MKEACEANLENLFSKLDLVLPGGNYYILYMPVTPDSKLGEGKVGGGGTWLIRFFPYTTIIPSRDHMFSVTLLKREL